MPTTPLEIAKGKLIKRSQEYQLLTLRLESLLRDYNPNSQKTRKYTEDTELINNSENRLIELEGEIVLLQRRVVDLTREESKNMVFTPRDEELPKEAPPTVETQTSISDSSTSSGETVKGSASGGTIPKNRTFVPEENTQTFPQSSNLLGTPRTEMGDPIRSEPQNDNSTYTTYSYDKPKSAGDMHSNSTFPPKRGESLDEKRARQQREHTEFMRFQSKYNDGAERFDPYPSVFDREPFNPYAATFNQSFQQTTNNRDYVSSNKMQNDEYELKPSRIKTNPYYTPKKSMNTKSAPRNVQFDQNQCRESNVDVDYSPENEPPQYQHYRQPQTPDLPLNMAPPNYGNQQYEEKARDTFVRRLRAIPKFNGEAYNDLRDFVDIMTTLYTTCSNQTEEDELYQHMLLQLRGEAKSIVLNLNNANWHTIRETLLSHFSYLSNQSVLTSQLENWKIVE